ncbi:uncharacterized protein LOC111070085 [Drosophila obscura]|uniref:uncharacterized protein LOC111070085 n=1 Tax=Drosophila obscura TaxID=7282 RepID=UPI001BB2C213|nr:uncharacterized protein LOC111070085 [Drosophila obscura]
MDGGSEEELGFGGQLEAMESMERMEPGTLLDALDALVASGVNMQSLGDESSSPNASDWGELQWDHETDTPWHLRGEESTVSFQAVLAAQPQSDCEQKAMDELLSARLMRDTLPEDTPLPTYLAFREPRCPSPESRWDAPCHQQRRSLR